MLDVLSYSRAQRQASGCPEQLVFARAACAGQHRVMAAIGARLRPPHSWGLFRVTAIGLNYFSWCA